MADMGEARSTSRDAVVRPLSRVAGRPCARPGCPSPARATLSFRYATREAWLESLADESSPATYDLCSSHADRTRPPSGWAIVDERPAEDQDRSEPAPPRDLGGEHTVAVLAAALRAVPDEPRVPRQEPRDAQDDVGDDVRDDVLDDIGLEELELAEDLRDSVEDALAELAAVARRDADGPEQIAIELDDEPVPPAAAPEPSTEAPAPAEPLVPRPVRAARERAGDDLPGGPARAW